MSLIFFLFYMSEKEGPQKLATKCNKRMQRGFEQTAQLFSTNAFSANAFSLNVFQLLLLFKLTIYCKYEQKTFIKENKYLENDIGFIGIKPIVTEKLD